MFREIRVCSIFKTSQCRQEKYVIKKDACPRLKMLIRSSQNVTKPSMQGRGYIISSSISYITFVRNNFSLSVLGQTGYTLHYKRNTRHFVCIRYAKHIFSYEYIQKWRKMFYHFGAVCISPFLFAIYSDFIYNSVVIVNNWSYRTGEAQICMAACK